MHAPSSVTRAQIADAAEAAGFALIDFDLMAELETPPPALPAEILLVDCPDDEAASLAALIQLDMRAASGGVRLIVSTTLDSLDSVFACLDQSGAEVLVQPTTGERVIALARALIKVPRMTVRDLDEADRLTLLRLTEQVGQIAAQLDRLSSGEGLAFRLESPAIEYNQQDERPLIRTPRAPLPDPRLVRRIIRQRQLRAQFLSGELFADPAWDILLDLTAARAEHTRVSVTSLCIASGVPATTALRWIGQMVDAGLLERVEDDSDRRRAFIQLSDRTAEAMARYFAELGKEGLSLV
ncbi:winged helix DNA-binding protein [Tsuneonella aeria]|uniref:winged helix DNA-binding protein n=1 Tax=Tsuneonella aeria TaxID=1837929 RepID=UPI00301E0CBE